jgi:DNA ligase-associated metallophosphoesterase
MKKSYAEIILMEETFYLLPQKALYRPVQKQLILSDIHLGKASHFRKGGIPMPLQSHLKDIDKIHFLLNTWKPETVLILGDLFHSEYNSEWLWFKSLLMEYPDTQFVLVEGNHDILPSITYAIPNLLKIGLLEERNFIFSHHPLVESSKLNICGHVHPGLRITGIAKQSVQLPCFYKSETLLILPAFGDLTGLKLLERDQTSDYFLVLGDRVTQV